LPRFVVKQIMTSKQELILSLKSLKANFKKYTLRFKNPAKTSRDTLVEKEVWFLMVYDETEPNIKGIGEVAPIFGLSVEQSPCAIEEQLELLCKDINNFKNYLNLESLENFPSIKFALEVALIDLCNRASKVLFKNDFTENKSPIPINGLIWMNDADVMRKQIDEKIIENFTTIKLKIGAIRFQEELDLIEHLRNNYSHKITIRLDANGAFEFEEALEKLQLLSKYNIHSIEQPIKAGQHKAMAELCAISPIKIALDEELIGVKHSEKEDLIKRIKPDYLILKPSLLGGLKASENWIALADKYKTGYWVTSALESNVGLNAIAQWTFNLNPDIAQGLGTGQLFTNNIFSPLHIDQGQLIFNKDAYWDFSQILMQQFAVDQ